MRKIITILLVGILIVFGAYQIGQTEAELGKFIRGFYRVATLELPLNLFWGVAPTSTSTIYPFTTSTKPGWEYDDKQHALVWADGEVTPAVITFTVPSDYYGEGFFEIFTTHAGDAATPCAIDFDVFINEHNIAADTSATGQTPVDLATGVSLQEVDLKVLTDFDNLEPNQRVHFRFWRDDTANVSTSDLEVRAVTFKYLSVWHLER